MANLSKHSEWLALVEISGPFLAMGVLDRVFPQGLEAVYPESKRRIRSAYEEWCDAIDNDDRALGELHQAWLKLVLAEFLEYPEDVLLSGNEYHVSGDDGNGLFRPDWILKGNDDKPMLFIKAMPPQADLLTINRQDDWTASVLDKMTKLCRINNVRLGLITDGQRWMLVNAPNGSTSGHISWYARLWFQEPKTLQAFSSLLGVRRFFGRAEDTLSALLDESLSCLEEITDTLGSQVRTAVEVLIQGLDKADEDRNRELLRDVAPSELYEAGLTVMMRLVFVLCAEERGLLLPGNETYDQCYAVSTLRGQLSEEADKHGAEILERRHDAWARLLAVFRIVYGGIEHEELRLPALGGSIFDPDKFPFLEGRNTGSSWKECNPTPLPIDNRTVLLLLNSLQVLEQSGGAILLSYRALDVEQIGHIYEGLLEHTAMRAQDVTLGLSGSSKAKNPNVRLSLLESLAMDSESALFTKLKEITMRSPAAIKNGYSKAPAPDLVDKLSAVCAGDQTLIERIKPFANYLRMDAWEQPLVYPKDAFMVTLGQDRRESGTHYTPKILTEKIVKTTLEPVVYRGPAEGKAREEWTLKTPAELLNLKICDPAMGSGAFGVQVCRYLAERLFEAWDQAERNGKFVTADGRVCDTPNDEPMTKVVDERINEARRLIAEKCLYGVDINPLAVELAKLSIWLVTISKGRPFGYLDHNLKSGDSLLGVHDVNQLRELRMKPDGKGYSNLFGQGIGDAVDTALKLREDIRNTPIRDITDVEYMDELNTEAQQTLVRVKLLADLFIGEAFSFTGNSKKLQERLDTLSVVVDDVFANDEEANRKYRIEARKKLDTDLPPGKPHRIPFHWALEFPEVFQSGGFDAICGNPPFLGGLRITELMGEQYNIFLGKTYSPGGRLTDLCAFFFRCAFECIGLSGCLGFLATNTIAQSTTRLTGLSQIIASNGIIYDATPSFLWPGTASVFAAMVHISKNRFSGRKLLDGKTCQAISSLLTNENDVEYEPQELIENKNKCYEGSTIWGDDFFLDESIAKRMIDDAPQNIKVIKKVIGGAEINRMIEIVPNRWVVDMGEMTQDQAEQFQMPYNYLQSTVYEKRRLLDSKKYKRVVDGWWKYFNARQNMYKTINNTQMPRVLARSRVSDYHIVEWLQSDIVYTDAAIIFLFSEWEYYALLQSVIHEVWARKFASTMKNDMRYIAKSCFDTFPFPLLDETKKNDLSKIGQEQHSFRIKLCMQHQVSRVRLLQEVNNFKTTIADISPYRLLLSRMDSAVVSAYGWNDIELEHDFYDSNKGIRYTISEPARIEILRRLAILNKQRWQEEQEAENGK